VSRFIKAVYGKPLRLWACLGMPMLLSWQFVEIRRRLREK
jgi:hypothetical protein